MKWLGKKEVDKANRTTTRTTTKEYSKEANSLKTKIMAKSARFYYNTRYVLPTMIGIIVGFGLSMLCTPFFYCDSVSFNLRFFESSNVDVRQMGKLQKEQYRALLLEQQRQIDDFEPRINLEGDDSLETFFSGKKNRIFFKINCFEHSPDENLP